MRIVVYAEGSRELDGVFALYRRPTSNLPEEEWGAAHVLVRRTIEWLAPERVGMLRFEEPLRLVQGLRRPRGSDLLDRKNLRRLLTWGPGARPDLAVVLVDEDGKEARLSTLKSYLDPDAPPPVAIGVAVREFEGWLIGDMQAVRGALDSTLEEPPESESMEPGHAKGLLDGWVVQSGRTDPGGLVRKDIAERIVLDRLERSSRSFRRFHGDLASALARAR